MVWISRIVEGGRSFKNTPPSISDCTIPRFTSSARLGCGLNIQIDDLGYRVSLSRTRPLCTRTPSGRARPLEEGTHPRVAEIVEIPAPDGCPTLVLLLFARQGGDFDSVQLHVGTAAALK